MKSLLVLFAFVHDNILGIQVIVLVAQVLILFMQVRFQIKTSSTPYQQSIFDNQIIAAQSVNNSFLELQTAVINDWVNKPLQIYEGTCGMTLDRKVQKAWDSFNNTVARHAPFIENNVDIVTGKIFDAMVKLAKTFQKEKKDLDDITNKVNALIHLREDMEKAIRKAFHIDGLSKANSKQIENLIKSVENTKLH